MSANLKPCSGATSLLLVVVLLGGVSLALAVSIRELVMPMPACMSPGHWQHTGKMYKYHAWTAANYTQRGIASPLLPMEDQAVVVDYY